MSDGGLALAAASHTYDNEKGAVFVWERQQMNSTFSPYVTLTDPAGSSGDVLGYGGVTLSDNGLLLVSTSYTDDEKGDSSGSVLLWERGSISTSFEGIAPVKLIDPDGTLYDYLGYGGVCVSANGLILASSAYGDDEQGSGSGSVLVWERDNASVSFSSVEPIKLTDVDGDTLDYLGYGGVGLSANGLVLASGSYQDDDQGSSSGSVVVWERENTATSFASITSIKLTDPAGANSDQLSRGGVAVSGNGLVLASSSNGDDDQGTNSGSVLVWERANTSISFEGVPPVKLVDPEGISNDFLGRWGVALNGNGLVLASTSTGDDEQGESSGTVLIWERANSSTSFASVAPAKFTDSTGRTGDLLGYGGVTLSANGLVFASSAYADDDQGASSGSVFVWERVDAAAQFESEARKYGLSDITDFQLGYGGATLSANGLVLAAGTTFGNEQGSILVWERQNATSSFANATPPVQLTDPDGASLDWLGSGGASLSEDGLVLASSSFDDDKGDSSGSILVWSRNDPTLSFASVVPEKLVDPDGSSMDYLGQGGVTLSSNGLVLVSSSYGDDDRGSVSGSLLVWERTNISTPFNSTDPIKLIDPDGSSGDYLGFGGASMSANTFVLASSSYGDDTQGDKSGSVLVWERTNSTTSFSSVVPVKLYDANGSSSDYLGYGGVCVSANALVLASSSYGDDDKGTGSGSVIVWERRNTSTSFASVVAVKLVDPNGVDNLALGFGGVSLSESGIVLSSSSYKENSSEGSVLVWDRTNTTTSFANVVPVKISDPEGSAGDLLGYGGVSLAANGLVLASSSYGSYGEVGSVLVWESICESGYAPPLCMVV